jgi:hypothetical protein
VRVGLVGLLARRASFTLAVGKMSRHERYVTGLDQRSVSLLLLNVMHQPLLRSRQVH